VPVAKYVNHRAEEITSAEGHNCRRKLKMRDTSLNGKTTGPVVEHIPKVTSSKEKK